MLPNFTKAESLGLAAHAAVWFDLFFIELGVKPLEELIHDRLTVLLVKREAIFLNHTLIFGKGIVFVNIAQRFQNMTTFAGKVFDKFHEFSSSMTKAVGQESCKSLWCVS